MLASSIKWDSKLPASADSPMQSVRSRETLISQSSIGDRSRELLGAWPDKLGVSRLLRDIYWRKASENDKNFNSVTGSNGDTFSVVASRKPSLGSGDSAAPPATSQSPTLFQRVNSRNLLQRDSTRTTASLRTARDFLLEASRRVFRT